MAKSASVALLRLVLVLSFSLSPVVASAMSVETAEAPTNDLALIVGAIKTAQTSIRMNIYEFTSPDITQALIDRINAGVDVEVLQEGQLAVTRRISTAGLAIQSQILSAMQSAGSKDRLFEMTSQAGGKRRYAFDHAKYIVIDNESLVIGSENYSPTGAAQPGSVGNRGWVVFIQNDPEIAQAYTRVFETDANPNAGDVEDLTAGGVRQSPSQGNGSSLGGGDLPLVLDQPMDLMQSFLSLGSSTHPKPKPKPKSPKPGQNSGAEPGGTTPVHRGGDSTPVQVGGLAGAVSDAPVLEASDIQQATSPDTSVSSIVRLIQNAQHSIDIEQMTFDSAWKGAASSPILDAVVAAAHKGVAVRVLMNDEAVFNTKKPKNPMTAQTLINAGAKALIANVQAMGVDYIHNKGMLVDGDKTLVSSINWDENSFEKNREAAVIITSPDVFNHYEALFDSDWRVSGGN